MVLLTSTFDFMFLLAQKMTCPYSAQTKELLLASSCHPPSPQMAWYAQNLPQHLIMGILYTHITVIRFVCLTAMNMKYLWHTSCTGYVQIYNDIQQVHTGYKREVHSFDITKSWINFPRQQKICIYMLSVHTYLRVKTGWYMVPL